MLIQALALLRRIKWWQAGAYLILLIGLIWLVLLFLTLPEKILQDQITLPGLSAETQVLIDTNGFYKIVARNQSDLYLTLGYLQAAQQLDFMDLLLRAATGNLTEIYGSQVEEVDALVRSIGFEQLGQQALTSLDTTSRALLGAYADGVNQLIYQHARELSVRLRLHRIEPLEWSAARVIAVLRLYQWCLANDWQLPLLLTKLAVIYTPEKIEAGFPFLKGFTCNASPSPHLLADLNRFYASNQYLRKICGLDASSASSHTKVFQSNAGESILVLSHTLPWRNYLIGWQLPEIQAVGYTLPGTPFLMTGRSGTAVWQVNYLTLPQTRFYTNTSGLAFSFEWDGNIYYDVPLWLSLAQMSNPNQVEAWCKTKPLPPLEIFWGQGSQFVKFRGASGRMTGRPTIIDFSYPVDYGGLDSLYDVIRSSPFDTIDNPCLPRIPRYSQRTIAIAPAIWQVCRPMLDREEQPLASCCKRTLDEWSKWPTAITSGSLIFQTFASHLLKSIYADELNLVDEQTLAQLLTQGDWIYTNLYYLLQDGTSSWFDNIQTSDKVEFASEIIRQAWQNCLTELQTKLGFDTLNYEIAAVKALEEPRSKSDWWTKIFPGLVRTGSIFYGRGAAQNLWLPIQADWLELRCYSPENNRRFWEEWKARIDLPGADTAGSRVVVTFIPQEER